jgi:transposase
MVWRQGQSYSEDLRARVLATIDGGMAARAAAELFRVSVSYIDKALIRRRRTGQVIASTRRGHRPRKLSPAQEAALAAHIEAHPDLKLAALQAWLMAAHGVRLSNGAMWSAVARLGLSFKKTLHASEQDRPDLIPREIYDDLKRNVDDARRGEHRPRFDLGLDTGELIGRLDLLSGLDERQLDRVERLLRPHFTVPGEHILRQGDRADAVYFIASGAVEVQLSGQHIQLGSGAFFGEMALLTHRPRSADVVALTFCRLLVLRKADFEKFMAENPDARAEINRVALARQEMNRRGLVSAAEG